MTEGTLDRYSICDEKKEEQRRELRGGTESVTV